jgi:hypothetical protein
MRGEVGKNDRREGMRRDHLTWALLFAPYESSIATGPESRREVPLSEEITAVKNDEPE